MRKIHTVSRAVLAVVLTTAVQFHTVKPTISEPIVPLAQKADSTDLSSTQVLRLAYAQAKADGHKDPAIVQGVILQESKAGDMASYRVVGIRGNENFGLGQLKLGAARDVMALWPALWTKYSFHTRTDDELKANLILNQSFNIEMTSKYLKLLSTRYGFQGRELLNAYNRGPGGVKMAGADWHYALGAEAKLSEAKRKGKL